MVSSQSWDIAQACKDFEELISYSLRDVSVIPEINKFLHSGECSFVIAEVDSGSTELTAKDRVRYKLADRLEILLATCRTKHLETNKTQIGLIYGITLHA